MKFISQERRSPIILIAVLFTLLIIISGQIKQTSEKTVLKNVCQMATSPLARGASGTVTWVYSVWDKYMGLLDADREYRSLKKELDILKLRQMLWVEEKKRLRKMEEIFNLEGPSIDSYLHGEVVFLTMMGSSYIAAVNRGSRDGVEAGMNVVTPQGLAGIVKIIEERFSKVVLLSDTSSEIAVKVVSEGKEVQAILAGNGSGCSLKYLISQHMINIGDEVLTSGKDRICSPGLLVGTVETVDEENPAKPHITVKLSVDFNELNEVIILKRLQEKPDFIKEIGGTLQ